MKHDTLALQSPMADSIHLAGKSRLQVVRMHPSLRGSATISPPSSSRGATTGESLGGVPVWTIESDRSKLERRLVTAKQGITIPLSKAAPLAIARTKSTMSFRSDGFFAKAQRWARKGASERGLLTWIKVELIAIKMTTGKMTVCKAAPLAIARTKSTMSFRSDGFFAKAQRWFSPDGTETPATRTPVTRSAVTSRRSSFDRSDSMVQTGTPPKDSPVVALKLGCMRTTCRRLFPARCMESAIGDCSARESRMRSDSMVQTGTPPKDSPVVAPRLEDGGDIAANGIRDADEDLS
jgi:hypothetical protein